MNNKQDYLLVEVQIMVPLGPDSEAEWPEERCAEKYRELVEEIGDQYTISKKHDWWVVTA